MKRLIALLTACLLLWAPALAEEDDDLTMEDVLSQEDPGIVAETIIHREVDSAGNITEEVMLGEDGYDTEGDGSVTITITATGDFTIGGDSRKKTNIFATEMRKHDNDVNFTMVNMRDLLRSDDLTIVNFEGTLTDSKYVPSKKKNNQFLFSAPPAWVSVLPDNGVEAVSLENNHIMDHGEEAYAETQQHLTDAGIVWSNSDHVGVYEVKGVEIAMLSYLCIDRYETLWDKVPADIAAAKEKYPIVIVSFHWGNEKDYSPTANQVRMGRLAVDSGADLVLGHHSHRMNPIELYKGVYICYSLGNFCFAGNSKPDDMTSIVFQTRFNVKDGEVTNRGFRIIPIRISSRPERNDFIPTPLTKPTSVDGVLSVLGNNGKKLEYAVDSYPLEW